MKTILFLFFAISISIHCTACVDDAPYIPRDTIRPQGPDSIMPPPPPLPPCEEPFFGGLHETMPRFPGCEDFEHDSEKQECSNKNLLAFIYDHLNYPTLAKENSIEGMVVVSFKINEDGSVSTAKIVRDIGAGCGEEALRVVNLMRDKKIKWIPGTQRKRVVKVQYNLPVKFKLPEREED